MLRPYANPSSTSGASSLTRARNRSVGLDVFWDNAQLHVHHNNYANYAQERLEDLIILCSSCHQRFHFLEAS
jgi:5-methylcytosine-specific restriction endonuclease McrA